MNSTHYYLASKFSLPRIPENVIKRPQLLHKLQNYNQKRMTLVSAPCGYGKTTAIAQWIETLSNTKTACISLDANDNSPSLFFHYLIDAFNKIFPERFTPIQGFIESMSVLRSKEIIVRCISVLETISEPVLLVFDDYHVIEDLHIHEAMHFFIRHKPETVHVCILTRNDPPMPLGRFRVNDEIIEIRKNQLMLCKEEMKRFIKDFDVVSGNENELHELYEVTEGWITALRLVTLNKSNDLPVLLKKLKGIDRTIEDYLFEEVFTGLSDEIQDFLLKTSILEKLNPDLCNHISSSSRAMEILTTLESKNLFIVSISDDRQWFRYHRLFRDYLLHFLKKKYPDLLNHLHRLAFYWLDENKYYYSALFHCLTINELDLAVKHIEKLTSSCWNVQFSKLIDSWVLSLPDNAITACPNLAIYRARIALRSSVPEDALKFASIAEHQFNTPDDIIGDKNELKGRIALVKSSALLLKGEVFKSFELSSQALALFEEHSIVFRCIAASTIGAAQIWMGKGELQKAVATFDLGVIPARRTKHVYFESVCAFQKSIALKFLGCLNEARDCLNELVSLLDPHKSAYPGMYGNIQCECADILHEQGECQKGLTMVEDGLETTELSLEPLKIWWSTWCAARIHFYLKNSDAALILLDTLDRISSSSAIPFWFNSMSNALRTRLYLAQHRVEEAEKIFRIRDISEHSTLAHANEMEHLAYCRYLLYMNNFDICKHLVSRIIAMAKETGRNNTLLEALLLQSVLLLNIDRKEEALPAMRSAIEIGFPQRYIRLFKEESALVEPLHTLALKEKNSKLKAYINSIHEAPPCSSVSLHKKDTSDLTEREVEMLKMVAHGYSNFELADKMYVSINTVKTHLKKINLKLETSSRTHAVAEARLLGILE